MGRKTNSRPNRRQSQGAYVGYWLRPKGHGERLDGWRGLLEKRSYE